MAASASPGARASAPASCTQAAQPNGGLTVKDFQILGPIDRNSHVVARDNGAQRLLPGEVVLVL